MSLTLRGPVIRMTAIAWSVASVAGGCSSGGATNGLPEGDAGAVDSCPGAHCFGAETGAEAGGDIADAAADSEPDASTDSATDAAPLEAGGDSGADAGMDSAPAPTFGESCPIGTVYTDNFTSDPVQSGTWTVLAGAYTWMTNSITVNAGSPNSQLWIGPRPQWKDYTVRVPITLGGVPNAGINFRMEDSPRPAPADSGDMYYAGLDMNHVVLGMENGSWTLLAYPSASFAVGVPYILVVSVKGSAITVSVSGTTYINYTDSRITYGAVGLRTFNTSSTYGPLTVTCD